MKEDKYDRQIRFFGEEGQAKISATRIVVLGAGGLGSHVAQQAAYLGVKDITLIDHDTIDTTSLNRLIGTTCSTRVGDPKVDVVSNMVKGISTDITVTTIQSSLMSAEGLQAIQNSHFVFSCMDNDGGRFVLNEHALAYEVPFIDIASDILPDGSEYGGRVVSVVDKSMCLLCSGEIDAEEAGKLLENPEAKEDRKRIYGVLMDDLGETGPSVVTINGVIASLALTEFTMHITGKRPAQKLLTFYGSRGIVNSRKSGDGSCFYCHSIRGSGDSAGTKQYILK